MSKKNESQKQEQSFESSIERLESIVELMESGKLPLEELLARYEEGVQLVKSCSEKLDAAGKRIEIIARDAGGKPRVEEFESSAKPAQPEKSEDVSLF